MALSEIDRNLIERCLSRKPKAWEDFVDRYMGLVVHVVNHTAQARSIRLTPDDREDLCAEVLLTIVKDDFAVLRHFRCQSSLATYLTVVARRVVVRSLLTKNSSVPLGDVALQHVAASSVARESSKHPNHHEEVSRLLEGLEGDEAEIVRLYHLEGKSYREISSVMNMPENSVGPTLTRARQKMRRAGVDRAAQ